MFITALPGGVFCQQFALFIQNDSVIPLRMDVMDLIKLASAEDSERRKSTIEENSCLLDCGDGSATDTLVACDLSDAVDVFPTLVRFRCFHPLHINQLQGRHFAELSLFRH